MKTSVSLSVFEAPKKMPALFSGGTEENISRIKALGYDGVDLFIRDPHDPATDKTIALLKQYELGVGAIMPAALAGEGLFLSDVNPEIRKEAIRRIGEIVEIAGEVGGMVSLGLVRGNKTEQESYESFEERFTESCMRMLELAEPLQVDLIIEPINRYEINTMNSVRETLDYLKKVKLPLYLMLDTFHMNIEDVNIAEMLLEALPYTKHIHFLDSNRLSPSMGHLDMESYYELLKQAGYQGYLCLEALPTNENRDLCAVTGAEFFERMKEKEQEK